MYRSRFYWGLGLIVVVEIFIIIIEEAQHPPTPSRAPLLNHNPAKTPNIVRSTASTKAHKPNLILFWSNFFGDKVQCDPKPSHLCNNNDLKQRCQVPCEVTSDRNRAANASIMIVHARDPRPLPPVTYNTTPLVLLTHENPVYTPVLYDKTFLSSFTYLMSYRPDVADFFLPSFGQPSLEKPIPFANKTGLIAAAFSNCESVRTAYLRELMKHIKVDSYGGCLRNKKGLPDRYVGDFMEAKTRLLRNYKFTIVFFNQDCDYFIDSQLTHALSAGSVPVYMGTDKVNELLAGNLNTSIIKVKDFRSPQKLAEYLLLVSKNETLYNKYLKWKYEGFQFPPSFLSHPQVPAWKWDSLNLVYCDMCRMMTDIRNNQRKAKEKGLIKPDYCKPRAMKDWNL